MCNDADQWVSGADRIVPWSDFQRFRTEMREIYPDVVDLTESFPDRAAYFPGDPFHYLPETGVQILRKVLVEKRGVTHGHLLDRKETRPVGESQ